MKTTDRAKQASRRIKERVKPKQARDRGPVTLYLDLDLFRDFKKECENLDLSASLMFEEFMKEFLGK